MLRLYLRSSSGVGGVFGPPQPGQVVASTERFLLHALHGKVFSLLMLR
jgi:hypothetical protein